MCCLPPRRCLRQPPYPPHPPRRKAQQRGIRRHQLPAAPESASIAVLAAIRSPGPARDRRDDDAAIGTWVDGGEWALYNNRSWEPDSYNDWWHDRPDRAYPRWMLSNQNCERKWWSGSGWKC